MVEGGKKCVCGALSRPLPTRDTVKDTAKTAELLDILDGWSLRLCL